MTNPTVELETARSLMVSYPERLTDAEVSSHVGSCWALPPVWSNVIGGRLVTWPNPRQERKGDEVRWVWMFARL